MPRTTPRPPGHDHRRPHASGPTTPIDEAARALSERGIGGAPVVDDDGAVVGLLEDDDLIVQDSPPPLPDGDLGARRLPRAALSLAHFEADLRKAVGATVADVMDADPPTCGPDDTLEQVATVMHERNLSRLPVVDDDGALVGIVAARRPRAGHRRADRRGLRPGDRAGRRGPRSTWRPSATTSSLLAALAAPAELCAVVKAWGYGHGPVAVAGPPSQGGATWLAVALVEEGAAAARRRASTRPCSLLSEPPVDAMDDVVGLGLDAHRCTPTPAWRRRPRRWPRPRAGPARGARQGRHRDAPGGRAPGRRGEAGPDRA